MAQPFSLLSGLAPPASNKRDPVAVEWIHNASGVRVNTDILVYNELQVLHPFKNIRIVPKANADILAFAAAGGAIATPDPDSNATPFGPYEWHAYIPPETRLSGKPGGVSARVLFGKYFVEWENQTFVVYLAESRDGEGYFPTIINYYIIAPTTMAADGLIMAAGQYTSGLHDEVWVFDNGYWRKDAGLWQSTQKASWDGVILDLDMKKGLIKDINHFFDGQETYNRLQVPWKRGLIFYGPPGNGKTISIKATMNMLYGRKDPVPTLYVKTLTS
jgi:transitional endoplasmic reticulum ATPase